MTKKINKNKNNPVRIFQKESRKEPNELGQGQSKYLRNIWTRITVHL